MEQPLCGHEVLEVFDSRNLVRRVAAGAAAESRCPKVAHLVLLQEALRIALPTGGAGRREVRESASAWGKFSFAWIAPEAGGQLVALIEVQGIFVVGVLKLPVVARARPARQLLEQQLALSADKHARVRVYKGRMQTRHCRTQRRDDHKKHQCARAGYGESKPQHAIYLLVASALAPRGSYRSSAAQESLPERNSVAPCGAG
eukprot:scaffold44555_cov58-Phaeocystis_antarctica.AAC.2